MFESEALEEEKKFAAVRRREVKLETMSEWEKSGRGEEERRKREMKKRDVMRICVVVGCFVMRKRFFRSAIVNVRSLTIFFGLVSVSFFLLCFLGKENKETERRA